MKHLDEGSIHAWLDGALSQSEAREVSSHAATCPQCGALVAEARGFVAGASRILTSLDGAPAGVVPMRAAPAPRPARFWQAAPWVTGIAAVLVLAIGVRVAMNRAASRSASLAQVFDSAGGVDSPRPSPPVDAGLRAAVTQPSAVAPVAAVAPRVPSIAPSDSAAASRTLALGARRAVTGEAGGAGAVASTSNDARAREMAVPAAAAEAVGDRPRADGAAAKIAAEAEKKAAAALRPEPLTARQAFAEAMRPDPAVRADPSRYAGCYAIPDTAESQLNKVLDAAGKVVAVAEAPRPMTVRAPAAAPPPAARTAESRVVRASVVRLDTTLDAPGAWVVRNAATDQRVGLWQVIGDSIRVIMNVQGTRMLSRSARITCTSRP